MIDRFIAHIESERRLSALTVRNYKHDIITFAEWFSKRTGAESFDATKVEAGDVSDYILYRLDTGKLQAASMNRELSSIKSFFRYLHKVGVVDIEVTNRIGSLKTPHILPVFVSESNIIELIENTRKKSYSQQFGDQLQSIVISLLYGCGIRLAELCAITRCDINSDSIKIIGKGDKHRLIPLVPELAARIERYLECCAANGIIIGSKDKIIRGYNGKPICRTSVQRIVSRAMSEAFIQGRKSPHVLRHTFATHLLNKGVDMRQIQELMGHSTLQTTQHYTHNSISQLQAAYAKAHPHSKQKSGQDGDKVD